VQILFSRCCGLDVDKDSVTACVLVSSGSGEPEVRKKEFEIHWKASAYLRLWLFSQKITRVAMESTGAYWKSVWQTGRALFGDSGQSMRNPVQGERDSGMIPNAFPG
jgi:transposase